MNRAAMMDDRGKIITGSAIAFLALTFPLWFTWIFKGADSQPEPERADEGLLCVEEKEYMIANHMDILYEWRDALVRDGERTYESRDYPGQLHEIGLTKTCMRCHPNKEKFCYECHKYAEVELTCWQCHLEP